jgi:hypothetical protein
MTSSGGSHTSPFAVIIASIVPDQSQSERRGHALCLTFVNRDIKSSIVESQVTDIHFMPFKVPLSDRQNK